MDSSQLPSNAASPTGPVTSSTSAPLSVRDDPTPTSPPLSTSSGGKRPTPTHTPSSEGTVDDANTIKMVSPVGGETLYIDWNKDIGDNSELLAYLFDIMKRCMVVQSIALGLHSKREIMERKHGGWTFEEAKEVFDAFNKTATQVSKLWKGATIPGLEAWSQDRCDAQLITFITNMAFNCAIKSPRALNRHYAPWTSETYGETSIAQMQKIIDQIGFTEHDVFVDLGSGVGQLITYVAGATRVKKVVGVECAALPFSYSESMQFEFNRLMKWFKKRHQKYELIKGDFMEAKFRDLITREATIIFINNYAFTPALDTRIKHELLQHCRDGAKIVTTKKYAEGKESLTDRDMGDIEAMVDVTMLTTVEQPVSWTDKVVPYFLHTINRGKIERYFMEKKNNSSSALSQMAADSRRASLSSKESASNSSHGSREGSQIRERYSRQDKQELLKTEIVTAAGEEPTSGPLLVGSSAVSSSAMDSDASTMAAVVADVVGFGPTTRKQWKEYVEGSNKIKKTASPRGSSPRWNEPDRDYTPSAKKAKKAANNLPTSSAQLQHASVGPMAKTPSKATGAKKGRPRLSGHRLSDDAKEGMAEMHSLIVSPKPIQDQDSPNLVRIALNSSGSGAGSDGNTALGSPDQLLMRQRHEQIILNDPNQFGANHLQQHRLQQPAGPGQIGNGTLNLPPGYLLLNIENDLDRVVIDYFYALRNHLEQMMSEEYIRGLYDDINREQIRHRTLEEKVSAQEAVVQQILSMGVQHLKNRLSELDMDHVTEVTELLQGSKRIVAHHKELHQRVSSQETENASLEAKLRNVCPYGDRIVEKLHLLDQNDNAAIDGDKYIMLIQQTAIETGHPIPKLEPDPIDPNEVIANTQPAKRPRQRPRAGPGGKRGKPEENSEEMERQIQEIVQAALRVDSVAKEKERRARGGGAAAAGSSFGNAPLAPEQRQQRISSGSAIGPTNGNNSALATPTDSLSSMGLHPSLVSSIQNQGILGGQPQPNQGQNPQSILEASTSASPSALAPMRTPASESPTEQRAFRIPHIRKDATTPHGNRLDSPRNLTPSSSQNATTGNSAERLKIRTPLNKRDFLKTPSSCQSPSTPRKRPAPIEVEGMNYAKMESNRQKQAKRDQPQFDTPFDRILSSFDKEEKQAKHKTPSQNDPLELALKERRRAEKKAALANAASQSGLSTSTSPQTAALTEENLKKYAKNDEMAMNFVNRDTLMERLLGYKMMHGRIENYIQMGYVKVDPKTERARAYPNNDDFNTIGPSSSQLRTPGIINQVTSSSRPKTPPIVVGIRTEEPTPERRPRGPKTPPGSPGPRTPPPESSMLSEMDRSAIITQMASYTGQSTAQLEAYLGEELKKACSNIDKTALLETLKNALRSVGTLGQTYQPITSQPYSGFEVKRQSPCHLSDSISVKMELVSDCSLSPGSPSRDVVKPSTSGSQPICVTPAGIPQQGVLPPPPIMPPAPLTSMGAVYMPYMQMPAYVVPPPSLPHQIAQVPQVQQQPPAAIPQMNMPPPMSFPPPMAPPPPPNQPPSAEAPKYTFPPPQIPAVAPSNTSSVAVSVAPLPAAPMPNSSISAPVNSLAPAYAPYNMPQQQQQPMSNVAQNLQMAPTPSQPPSSTPVFSSSIPPPPPPSSGIQSGPPPAQTQTVQQPPAQTAQQQQQPIQTPNMAFPPPSSMPSMMNVPPPSFSFPPPMSQAPPPTTFPPILSQVPPPPPPGPAPITPQKVEEKPKMKMLEVKLIEIEPEKSKSGIPMKRAISPGNRPIAQGIKKIKEEGVGNVRTQNSSSPLSSSKFTPSRPPPTASNGSTPVSASISNSNDPRSHPSDLSAWREEMKKVAGATSYNEQQQQQQQHNGRDSIPSGPPPHLQQPAGSTNRPSNGPSPLISGQNGGQKSMTGGMGGMNKTPQSTNPPRGPPSGSAAPQVNIQNTLLSALGLAPKSAAGPSNGPSSSQHPPSTGNNFSAPPPVGPSSGPSPLASVSVRPPIQQGPQIVGSVGSEPVLLDRYGQPLPVPGESRERIRPAAGPPPTQNRFGPPNQPPHFR